MGEARTDALRLGFDRTLKLQFHGARVGTDCGLFAHRDLDEAAELTESAAAELFDFRTGTNIQHSMAALLGQSIYSRLAGYEELLLWFGLLRPAGAFPELADQVELDLLDGEPDTVLQFVDQFLGDVFEDAFAQVVRRVDDLAGLAAAQVQVVVAAGVVAGGPVAPAAGDLVRQPRTAERFERVVDRRQAHPVVQLPDHPEKLVGRGMTAACRKRVVDRPTLAGAAQAVLAECLL